MRRFLRAFTRIFKVIPKRRPRATTVLTVMSLIFIFSLALTLRLIPLRWGYYLTEFDPYWQYYIAKKIASLGWRGFLEWSTWHRDLKFWHPYGRDVVHTSLPGVSFVGAFSYLLLRTIGLDVTIEQVVVVLPAFLGALATLIIFMLGCTIRSRVTGLVAAFLLAINSAFATRTIAGFYDDESVAIPLMLLGYALYLKGMKSRRPWMYGILVGLVFTYVAATWGAYLYMVNVIALHVLLLLLLRDYDMKVLETYISFFITMFIGVSIVPKWGIRTFLSMSLALLWVPFIMALVEYIVEKMPQIGSRIPSDRKVLLPYMVFGAIVLIGGVVLALGILGRMSARYLSVINPALRKLIPLVESVGEHRAPTWASLFFDFSTTGVLGVMGIYFTLRRISRENLFAAVFGLSSLYAAASMARLTLLASPALCLLGGIAFAEFINPIRDTLRGAASVSRRRKKVTPTIGPIHGVIALSSLALIILMQILSPFLVAAFASPPLILTSSVPANERYNYEYIDWVSALEWVRDNLPEDAVIASWWDYGYWIAVAGNRTSVCDNSTINSTQIKLIARAFLSSEEEAIKIFKALGVKYVIVFEPYINLNTLLGLRIPFPIYVPHFRGYGDFGKSIWMARIAGLNERKYVTNGTISIDRVITFTIITPADTPEARNATLYKLLFYPVKGRRFIFNIGKEILRYIGIDWRGPDVNFEAPKYFRLVFASRPNAYVLIYEVLYEEAEEA